MRGEAELRRLWTWHLSEPFLVECGDEVPVGTWSESDWAEWDAAVAGHVITHLSGATSARGRAVLRQLAEEASARLQDLPEGAGREQMARMLLIARLLASGPDLVEQ